MLTIDTIPLRLKIPDSVIQTLIWNLELGIWNLQLFIFAVQAMATAATAKLIQLQSSRSILFVFRRYIVALFALSALQNYVISRHNLLPHLTVINYSTISLTVPAPTVLPPSLMAKRKPFSIAIGAISVISI